MGLAIDCQDASKNGYCSCECISFLFVCVVTRSCAGLCMSCFACFAGVLSKLVLDAHCVLSDGVSSATMSSLPEMGFKMPRFEMLLPEKAA